MHAHINMQISVALHILPSNLQMGYYDLNQQGIDEDRVWKKNKFLAKQVGAASKSGILGHHLLIMRSVPRKQWENGLSTPPHEKTADIQLGYVQLSGCTNAGFVVLRTAWFKSRNDRFLLRASEASDKPIITKVNCSFVLPDEFL